MSDSSSQAIVVLCTVSSQEEGRRIACQLVEGRLAACVNLLPKVESIYRWKEAVESAEEVLLVVKTTAERFAELRDRIVVLHSYEVPEVIALPVSDGSSKYLDWLRGQV